MAAPKSIIFTIIYIFYPFIPNISKISIRKVYNLAPYWKDEVFYPFVASTFLRVLIMVIFTRYFLALAILLLQFSHIRIHFIGLVVIHFILQNFQLL